MSKKKLGMKARQLPVAFGCMQGAVASISLIFFSNPVIELLVYFVSVYTVELHNSFWDLMIISIYLYTIPSLLHLAKQANSFLNRFSVPKHPP